MGGEASLGPVSFIHNDWWDRGIVDYNIVVMWFSWFLNFVIV